MGGEQLEVDADGLVNGGDVLRREDELAKPRAEGQTPREVTGDLLELADHGPVAEVRPNEIEVPEQHVAPLVQAGLEGRQAREVVGDRARDGRRAVHRGQYRDIIAGADLAIGAAEALERGLLCYGQNLFLARIFRETVITGEIAHADIVLVQP